MIRKLQQEGGGCSSRELSIESGPVGDSHDSNDDAGCVNGERNRDSIRSSGRPVKFGRRYSNSSAAPLVPQRRLSNSSDCMTMDKLRVENLGLYEREEQLEKMRTSLENLSRGLIQRHLILISGVSGSGKTALSNSLMDSVKRLKGLFVGARFDFESRHEPYSGVAMAFAKICGHIFSLEKIDTEGFQNIAQRIRNDLGSELALLIKIVPDLAEVTDFHDGECSPLVGGSSSPDLKNRLNAAFQLFVRIMSNEFAPLVLVLDDLQWVDGSSLDLLEGLLLDGRNTNLMIVGTYRSNEVEETHMLHHAIGRLKAKREADVFEVTQISIGNLSVDAVDKTIATLLSMDNDPQTMGLACICFKKTQGNPFFVLQFLQLLQSNGMLQFNYGIHTWTWNNGEIETSTSATDNVVDLLTAKMPLLPQHLLDILKIAACLGSTFNETCLLLIWDAWSSDKSGEFNNAQTVASGLEFLVQEGYITKHSKASTSSSTQTLSWAHEKIHDAAATLVPKNKRAMFNFEAGNILLSRLSVGDLESSIFNVAYLLDAGESLSLPNDEQRLKVARLNCDASVKALSISAFETVAEFSAKGIKFLPKNHWVDHYELSLDLYSLAAQAQWCLGNTDLMDEYCQGVLSQKERPIRDKLRVYYILVDSMIIRGCVDKAATLLSDVLEMCNCRFPRDFFSVRVRVIGSAFNMKAKDKCFNPDDLGEMENPTVSGLMKLLDRLTLCYFVAGNPRSVLVVHRSLEWTMAHGHCDFSPVAYASAGLILTGFLNDFTGGVWYGEQAIKLLEKSEFVATRSQTMLLVYARIFSWKKPLLALLEPLLNSYYLGLQSGDIECALWSIVSRILFRFITGMPLDKLDDDLRLYSKQMKDLKRESLLLMTNGVRQVVLNLMNDIESDILEPTGEVFTEEDHRRCNQDFFLSVSIRPWQGMLLTYFGDHIGSAHFVMQHGHDYLQTKFPTAALIPFDTYLRGISCFAAARETGKRKYARMGEKLRSKIKRWHFLGNPNVTHYLFFLDAESAAFKNKRYEAIKHYERTISFAGRAGFIHDVAFACERLAEFYLTVMADSHEAAYRMRQSVSYWSEWGAVAKVKALEKKYPHLCRVVSMSNISV